MRVQPAELSRGVAVDAKNFAVKRGIGARCGPGLGVHFSEAQQGKVFEKIAKQFSRVGCGRTGRDNFCERIRFYGEIFTEGGGGAAIVYQRNIISPVNCYL